MFRTARAPSTRKVTAPGAALLGWLVASSAPACTGLDTSQSALVVLDDEARRAGVTVEIGGEAQDPRGPITVPTGGEVAVRRGAREEPLDAEPGEVIAIEGAEGRVRRGVGAEQLVIDADGERAARFAELAGLRASPLPDGRYLIDGENAAWTALLFPDLAGTVSPWAAGAAASPATSAGWLSPDDATWAERAAVDLAPDEDPAIAAPSSDLASFVGAYVADDVVLVLDAAGGMHMTGRGIDRHGTFALDPHARLVLRFEDGDVRARAVAVERTADEGLRDAAGVRFRTMPVPSPAPRHGEGRSAVVTLVHETGL
jgi:hypothetical protein